MDTNKYTKKIMVYNREREEDLGQYLLRKIVSKHPAKELVRGLGWWETSVLKYLIPQKNLALDCNPLETDGNLASTGNWHILTTVVATASYWDEKLLDLRDLVSHLAGTS